MHKTKIEWGDYVWNPVTGCLYECEYCYVKKQAIRFSGDIRLHISLLENITTEFDDIIRKFEDKEAEIKNLDEYIAILEEEFKKI